MCFGQSTIDLEAFQVLAIGSEAAAEQGAQWHQSGFMLLVGHLVLNDGQSTRQAQIVRRHLADAEGWTMAGCAQELNSKDWDEGCVQFCCGQAICASKWRGSDEAALDVGRKVAHCLLGDKQ